MTSSGEWIHIADHAWVRHSVGAEFTIHKVNDSWIARGFSVAPNGDAVIEIEEPTQTLDKAKQLVQKWDSTQTCRHP